MTEVSYTDHLHLPIAPKYYLSYYVAFHHVATLTIVYFQIFKVTILRPSLTNLCALDNNLLWDFLEIVLQYYISRWKGREMKEVMMRTSALQELPVLFGGLA